MGALLALRDFGMVHADIKPDNVMLVDAENQPLRVKLIDFGLAEATSMVEQGSSFQPRGYRWVHPACILV